MIFMAASGESLVGTDESMAEGLSARQAILEVAIEQLASGGEASVRLAVIAEQAGVAIGLISYHFGGRDGLIRAAQQARYERRLQGDFDAIQRVLETVSDSSQLLHGLSAHTARTVASPEGAASRLERVALLGSMLGRPGLAADIGELQGALTDRLAAILRQSQDEGLVRADLDPRAIAIFAQAYAVGMVLADIDPNRPDDEALTAVVLAAVAGLVAT
jgi:AcrR family transcriptional regulator